MGGAYQDHMDRDNGPRATAIRERHTYGSDIVGACYSQGRGEKLLAKDKGVEGYNR